MTGAGQPPDLRAVADGQLEDEIEPSGRLASLVARRSSRATHDESGLALIWLALFLLVMLGFASLAVDLGHGYLVAQDAQNAADAAALAGAVYLPSSLTAATTTADSVAAENGFTTANSEVSAAVGAQPSQLKVTVTQDVDTWFAKVIGFKTMHIARSGTAQYLPPLSMGSPSNQFGNDPDSISTWPVGNPPPDTYPNFWANIAGGSSPKGNGDAYTAGTCDGSAGVATDDGCNADGANNIDYNANGYYYAVDVNSGGTLNLQAFDPAFVEVGDFCTDGSADLAGAAALTDVPGYPEGDTNTADIAKRFAPVTDQSNQSDPGFQYCTGDQIFNGGPAPATTYTILKAQVPGYPNTGQPVPGCAPITYPGFTGSVSDALAGGVTPPGAPAAFATYFRQWVTLCQVVASPGDEYFIEVSTDSGSQGHNRFALRVQTSSGAAAPVDLAANADMAIYANVGTAITKFYLTRVPSAAAGHTLVLSFYDIGDAPAGSIGTLTVLPPSDSNVGSAFGGCDWTGNDSTGALGYANNTPKSPWGDLTPIDNCIITGVNNDSANWNGQWSTVTIPIPPDYTCNDADPKGCWIKLQYEFTGGINDTTSWNAYLLGDPVRIVK